MNQFNVRLYDLAERAAWSFVMGAAGALPTMMALTPDGTKAAGWAALAGGVAALVSFLRAALATGAETPSRNIAVRFAVTFAGAFLGSLPGTIDLSSSALGAVVAAAAAAGVAAIFSAAKNLTGTLVQLNATSGVTVVRPSPPG